MSQFSMLCLTVPTKSGCSVDDSPRIYISMDLAGDEQKLLEAPGMFDGTLIDFLWYDRLIN